MLLELPNGLTVVTVTFSFSKVQHEKGTIDMRKFFHLFRSYEYPKRIRGFLSNCNSLETAKNYFRKSKEDMRKKLNNRNDTQA